MSRPESQAPVSRKRSNTAHSIFNAPAPPPVYIPAPPLKVGDQRVLTAWVNEPATTSVKLNHRHWPGVAEGDLICIASPVPEHKPGFLFVVPAEDAAVRHQLQVSARISIVLCVKGSVHLKETRYRFRALYWRRLG